MARLRCSSESTAGHLQIVRLARRTNARLRIPIDCSRRRLGVDVLCRHRDDVTIRRHAQRGIPAVALGICFSGLRILDRREGRE
jgi:hypothetical protein